MVCFIIDTQESIIFFPSQYKGPTVIVSILRWIYFRLQCSDHCGVSKRVNFPMSLSFLINKDVNMAQGGES